MDQRKVKDERKLEATKGNERVEGSPVPPVFQRYSFEGYLDIAEKTILRFKIRRRVEVKKDGK